MKRRRPEPEDPHLVADRQLSELERLLFEVGHRADELLRQRKGQADA